MVRRGGGGERVRVRERRRRATEKDRQGKVENRLLSLVVCVEREDGGERRGERGVERGEREVERTGARAAARVCSEHEREELNTNPPHHSASYSAGSHPSLAALATSDENASGALGASSASSAKASLTRRRPIASCVLLTAPRADRSRRRSPMSCMPWGAGASKPAFFPPMVVCLLLVCFV